MKKQWQEAFQFGEWGDPYRINANMVIETSNDFIDTLTHERINALYEEACEGIAEILERRKAEL